jgi:phosphodiesterase/alkaline phosphatase D-like protein
MMMMMVRSAADLPNWVGQTHYDWIKRKLSESKADWLIVVRRSSPRPSTACAVGAHPT